MTTYFIFYGGCYVTAKRNIDVTNTVVFQQWEQFCSQHFLPFEFNSAVLAPDDTTLFTTSGMQKYKQKFSDPTQSGYVLSDVQRCLRIHDLDEIKDNRHQLVFHMLGLFSFREWSLQQGIDFLLLFMRQLNIQLTHVTLHPDKKESWSYLYSQYNIPIVIDPDCQWSDGQMSSYCTEFYVGEIEVGNIVHPGGDCLDIGFGLERLEQVLGFQTLGTEAQRLQYTLDVLCENGVVPGPKKQQYVMRRLIRRLISQNMTWDHPIFEVERQQIERTKKIVQRLYMKNQHQTPEWWKGTHGVDIVELKELGLL